MAEVAVLVATYNGERYLSEQLDSLINQTFDKFICYIHDDGSNDNTKNIIRSYCMKYPSKIKELEYEAQGSPMNNFLSMLNLIQEPYAIFCDQDDVWLPEKIECIYHEMKKIERRHGSSLPIAVYSDAIVVDDKLERIAESFYTYSGVDPQKNSIDQLIQHNVSLGCTLMVNRCLYRKVMGVKKNEAIAMHDWLCVLVASAEGIVLFLPKQLMLYRQHGDNICGAVKKETFFKQVSVRAFWLLSGKLFKRIKETITRQRRRAGFILNYVESSNEQVLFLRELSSIGQKSKIDRVNFYNKYRLYRDRSKALVLLLC